MKRLDKGCGNEVRTCFFISKNDIMMSEMMHDA
jgi:hypothetical protein